MENTELGLESMNGHEYVTLQGYMGNSSEPFLGARMLKGKIVIMRKKDGFTLVELLVVIVIIAMLLSIQMPALSKDRERSRKIKCASSLKQIGIAFVLYAQNNNDFFAPNWIDVAKGGTNGRWYHWDRYLLNTLDITFDNNLDGISLAQYKKRVVMFNCPSNKHPNFPGLGTVGPRHYGMNMFICWDVGPYSGFELTVPYWSRKISSVKQPSDRILVADSQKGLQGSYERGDINLAEVCAWDISRGLPFDLHGGKVNILYVDGHAGDDVYKNLVYKNRYEMDSPRSGKGWQPWTIDGKPWPEEDF
jgi:prepilin-type N-terminal cleavage/methylation domain-containing protein/prepilin-type processing-associated H-X9-DG protein